MKVKKLLLTLCCLICVAAMSVASGCGAVGDNSGNGSSNSIGGSTDGGSNVIPDDSGSAPDCSNDSVDDEDDSAVDNVVGTDGLEYTLSEDGTYYSVTGYNGESAEVIIPSVYNDLPVAVIDGNAFFDCRDLLESVVIPDAVTSVGRGAFWDCSNLQKSEFDNGYYLGNGKNPYYVLIEAKSAEITSCVIHTDTKVIAGSAFSGCRNLASVEIPSRVMSIGNEAFRGCGLESVVIPDSVTTIEPYAFFECNGLTNVKLGAKVDNIGYAAFYCCRSLTDISVDDNNNTYKDVDGNLYTKDGATFIQYAIGKGETEFIVPNGVTSIFEIAFAECKTLVVVVIPDSVANIAGYAFHRCGDGLTIFCEVETKPSGWENEWNMLNHDAVVPVVWGYKR